MLRILFFGFWAERRANLVVFLFRELLGRSRCILLGSMQRFWVQGRGMLSISRREQLDATKTRRNGIMLSVFLRLSKRGGASEVFNFRFTARWNAHNSFSKSCWGTICRRPWRKFSESTLRVSDIIVCLSKYPRLSNKLLRQKRKLGLRRRVIWPGSSGPMQ